jgi:hypothetical protein
MTCKHSAHAGECPWCKVKHLEELVAAQQVTITGLKMQIAGVLETNRRLREGVPSTQSVTAALLVRGVGIRSAE